MKVDDDRASQPCSCVCDDAVGRVTALRSGGLTRPVRGVFLDTLAQTCSVSAAAAAAGRSYQSFYALRRRDRLFAEQWVAALAIGYETLEARLIDYAMGRLGDRAAATIVEGNVGEAGGAGGAVRPMAIPGTGLASGKTPVPFDVPAEIQVGLLLLARHRATLDGGAPLRKGRRVVTAAETDAVLNKRLDQLARSLGQTRP